MPLAPAPCAAARQPRARPAGSPTARGLHRLALDGRGTHRFGAPLDDALEEYPLDEYLRLVELGDGAWELQSATAVFRRNARFDETTGECVAPAQEVALAATVHVGDPTYYQGLQEECDADYDAVLFELITGEENLREVRSASRVDARRRATRRRRRGPSRSRSPAGTRSCRNSPSRWRPRRTPGDWRTRTFARAAGRAGPVRGQLVRRGHAQAGAGASAGGGGRGVGRGRGWPNEARPGRRRPSRRPPRSRRWWSPRRGARGGGPLRREATRARLLARAVPGGAPAVTRLGLGRRKAPSPVLGAMLDSLAGGNIIAASRLAFAQMIVSAQAKGAVGGGADVPVLVERRNDVALECLAKALDAPGVSPGRAPVRRPAHAGL